jgi:hypothetical protein
MEHPNHYPRGTCSGTDAALKAAEGNYYICPKCKKDIHEDDAVFCDGSDCIGPTTCPGSELEWDE